MTAAASTCAASWRMRSSASWPLRSVTISSGAPSSSGRARSRTSPSALTASAARARPGPIAAAASAPVAPSGSSSGVPSGSVTFMRRRCYASISGRRPAARMPAHSWCRVVTVRRSAGTSARLLSRAVDATALRAQFPVLDRHAYLNAGTCGPLPRRALHAAADVLARASVDGRTRAYMESMLALRDRQRAAYAERLGADPADVALTTWTSEGVVRVLAGLSARAGRRGPHRARRAPRPARPARLAAPAARRRRPHRPVRGARRRGRAPDAPGRLLARQLGHGRRAAGGPRAPRPSVPVLLDGAQGVGAVPIDVRALGCAFYAGSGQKWLCGPVGTGMLWIAPARRNDVLPVGATYVNLAEPGRGLESAVHPDARSHDSPALVGRVGRRGGRGARRPRRGRLGRGLRARANARRRARRPPARARPHGRRARPDDARLLGGRRPRGHARPPRRRRDRGPQPARHAVRARVGRGVERRGRPRPTRGGRGAGLSRAARGAGFATAVDAAAIGRVARRRRGSP